MSGMERWTTTTLAWVAYALLWSHRCIVAADDGSAALASAAGGLLDLVRRHVATTARVPLQQAPQQSTTSQFANDPKYQACSIAEAVQRSNFHHGNATGGGVAGNRSVERRQLLMKASKPLNSNGAILSVYTGLNRQEQLTRWACQLKNHEEYCTARGYKCYFVTDSADLVAHRQWIPGHWLKLQILPLVLELHPWVLFMDTDAVFNNPLTTPAVEDVLKLAAISSVSILMPDNDQGWSTDMIFVRRTTYSFHFLQHFWRLRHVCPNCNGEQCAGHVAMFDAMAHQLHNEVAKGARDDKIYVLKDRGGHVQCCNPKAHCEYPEGSKYGSGGQLEGNRNAGHNRNIQGCVWNWQTAMGYNPVKPLDSNGLTKHDHISWHVQLRAFLNISHPVKDMKCDNPVLAATSDFFSSGTAR